MSEILQVKKLSKAFMDGNTKTAILKGVDFSLKKSEIVAILGASGSGKTTFLQIIGALQDFDEGEVQFNNQLYTRLSDAALTLLREQHFGFVYQFHHLLQELTALENVMLPLMIRKLDKHRAHDQAKELLEKVGLAERLQHKPAELSGGERQRVALARAMVKSPSILFADEPTGNLDQKSSAQVMELMFEMSQNSGTAIVYITHDETLARQAHRSLYMRNGLLTDY